MGARTGGVHARSVDGKWSILVLVTGLVAAVPVLLSFGSGAWFNLDEWNFLADRELGNAFDPYQGHWVAVPTIVFRASFRLWGLHSYVPYQILIVLANVGTVALLWLVMRRLGVRSWIATGTALPVLLFGAGATNLLYAFQISLVGSLFCGLGHLLLADHDGPVGLRDFVGLGLGLIGLMCSGVAVSLVAGVGVAVLLRRGHHPVDLQPQPVHPKL